MKRLFYLTALLLLVTFRSQAQIIQVNSDGTHTTIIPTGNTSIQVNPDGTHSTIFHNGNKSTQINPDGTHSTIFNNGSTSIRVNPNGTHTVIFHQGNTPTQVNPDGPQTFITENRRWTNSSVTSKSANTDKRKMHSKKKFRMRKSRNN